MIKIKYLDTVSTVIVKKKLSKNLYFYVLDDVLCGYLNQFYCDVEIESGEYECGYFSIKNQTTGSVYRLERSNSLDLWRIFVETHAKLQELEKDLELFASTKQFIKDSEKLAKS